ncbi:LADA_0H01552g1_1 [Lachancea dasiensis]|uniref:LADA_0H01552g1_1 n=1 Tax=Lachancea dasiensis TaxID=1072105 RepID=A0A1G4JZC6_9SACH|nr:LADA_0H01552g1_1 [Lachancea dasiensis]
MITYLLRIISVSFILNLGLSETVIRELNISRASSEIGEHLISLNGDISSLSSTIRVQAGDNVNLLVNNDLCVGHTDWQLYGEEGCSTSIHFHGLVLDNVGGTLGALNDGVPGITQRSIPSNMSYWYNFTVPKTLQGGTYWYHAHSSVQYGDGLRGVLLVDSPVRHSYLQRVVAKLEADGTDGDLLGDLPLAGSETPIHEEILTVSDWYKKSSVDILKDVMSPEGGPDPHVDGSTLNGELGSVKLEVKENTEYVALRVINVGTSGTNILNVEGHRLCVVETDGVLTKPYMIETLSVAVGQRFTVLVKLDLSTPKARIIHGCGKMMGYVTKTHWIVRPNQNTGNDYDGNPSHLPGLDKSERYHDYVPLEGELLPSPRQQFSLDYYYDGQQRDSIGTGLYTVNGDTMAQFLPDGVLLEGARGIRDPIQLDSGEVVEIAINSIDHMTHPWHLHGHTFQVISVGKKRDGPLYFNERESAAMQRYLADVASWENKVPMTRDTINIPGSSYAVIRFRANNPGFWLLHCHVEWHMAKGLGVVLAEGDPRVESVASAFERSYSNAGGPATSEVSDPTMDGQSGALSSKWKVLLIYIMIMCIFNGSIWLFFFR